MFGRELSRSWFVGWALLALAPLAFSLLSPGSTLYFRDHGLAFRQLFQTVVEAYGGGSLPLWNPWTGGGEPLLADWNSMAASPLMLVFGGPWSFDFGYQLFVFAFFPIALFGAAWFAEQLGLDREAALLAGAMYALSGFVVSFNNLVVGLSGLALAPWAIGAALAFTVSPSLLRALGLSLSLSLHGEYTDPAFLVGDVLLYLVGVIHVRERLQPRSAPRVVLGLLGSLVLALGLIGVLLVPVISELSTSRRGMGFDTDYLSRFALHPLRIFELFLPGWSGDPVEGPVLLTTAKDPRLYVGSIYIGAAALPLVLLGAWVGRARKWLLLAALAVLLSVGPSTPLHTALMSIIPALSSSRFPEKFLSGAVLALAVVVALVWSQVRDGAVSSRALRSVGLLTCGLALSGPIALRSLGMTAWVEEASRFTTAEAARELMLRSADVGGLLAAAGAVCLWLVAAPERRRVAWILPLFVVGDLALRAPGLCPTIELEALAPPSLAHELHTSETRPYIFVYDAYAEPAHLESVTEPARFRYGVERLTSGHATHLRIRHLLDQDLREGRSPRWRSLERAFAQQPEPGRLRLLARMGVNHLLVRGSGTSLPGLTRVSSDQPLGGPVMSLYRIEGARPALGLESAWDFVPTASAALARAARDGPGGPLWLERGGLGTITSSQAQQTPTDREVLEVDEESPGFISAHVRTDGPRLLVLTQAYSTGWRAFIDGEAVPVMPGDGFLVTVPVGAGEHHVVLAYAPESVHLGAGLSAASLVVWLSLLLWGWHRRSASRASAVARRP